MSKKDELKVYMKLNRVIPNFSPEFFKKPFAIWGTGNTAALYQKGLERQEMSPAFYVDSNENKKEAFGKSVLHPTELKDKAPSDILYLSCSDQPQVSVAIDKIMHDMGLNGMNIATYIFAKNKAKVLQVLDMFEDLHSKKVYADLVAARIENREPNHKLFHTYDTQYFCLPQFRQMRNDFVLVDCGAYCGENLEDFIKITEGTFKSAYEFEPDPNNFIALQNRVKRLEAEWAMPKGKIVPVRAGVGAVSNISYIDNTKGQNSLGSRISNTGTDRIEVCSIDDYFKDITVSMIKADIESYEYDAIGGGGLVIKRDRPLLALCIYHNACDMFDIPLRVHELHSDYRMRLLHHRFEFSDAVLYCY